MRSPPDREDHRCDCFATWWSPPQGSSLMSAPPGLKGVPVGICPVAQYFIGRQLMLRERLTYEQWSIFDRSADVICNSILKQMPVDHPEWEGGENRHKGDQGAPR